jgi:tRNA modification GTPase
MTDPLETIAAIASALGGAARGIVRVSGPNMLGCVERCFRPTDNRPLRDIRAPTVVPGAVRIVNVATDIPTDLYLWPSTRSYTRQPTAELHTIGSPPLLEAIVDALCAAGARPALAGEFTLRAFLAGRLDLTRAEAVLGVIDARGEQQLATALAQLAGGLATPLGRLRDGLLDLLAEIEAGLDFAEEDIEIISGDDVDRRLQAFESSVEEMVNRMAARTETAALPRAVLVGAPNAGKSSLYNALSGQAALVSPVAGTTRDYLTARIHLDGVECKLVDTAGISSGATVDERQDGIADTAQRVSLAQQGRAEIEIVCLDASQPLTAADEAALKRVSDGERIAVLTKADRPRRVPSPPGAILTSSLTGEGLDRLRQRLREAVLAGERGEVVASTAARCRGSLREAAEALATARQLVETGEGEELVAMQLRLALNQLGQVVGAVYTDDILDRIFSRFCIGK